MGGGLYSDIKSAQLGTLKSRSNLLYITVYSTMHSAIHSKVYILVLSTGKCVGYADTHSAVTSQPMKSKLLLVFPNQ